MLLQPIPGGKWLYSPIKDRQEKYNAITLGTPLIIKEIQIQRKLARALIDYGSLVNIISEKTVQENNILV